MSSKSFGFLGVIVVISTMALVLWHLIASIVPGFGHLKTNSQVILGDPAPKHGDSKSGDVARPNGVGKPAGLCNGMT